MFISETEEKLLDKNQPGQQLNARTCHLPRTKEMAQWDRLSKMQLVATWLLRERCHLAGFPCMCPVLGGGFTDLDTKLPNIG